MLKNLKNKKKKGFTLIELIIVIAIIAILAAVAIPKFSSISKDAKIKSDIANAKTISNAVSALIAEDEIDTPAPKEGITIESECIGKVYSKEEYDKNEWTIYGEPDTTITVAKPSTVELTCATIVNRIPDVINAKPGFVPTSQFGELEYKVKDLNEYVK